MYTPSFRLCASLRGALPILLAGILSLACATPPSSSESLAQAKKHLDPKYVCPMHPQIIRDEPGSCPICGMTLIPRQIDTEAGTHPTVTISGEIVQAMGVRTARVTRGTLWKYIRAVGRVAYDETRIAHLHPRANGWVERLAVRAEGTEVRHGQVLGYLYAPDILSAQVDFLIALRQYAKISAGKADKARNLLRLLDVPEGVIREIEQHGETHNAVPLLAPIDGVVTRLGMRDGMYVTPTSERVLVDVFEQQLDWLKPGLRAEIRAPARRGRAWKGEVDYLCPELDPKTRALKVRLRFRNPEVLLRPNMFADVVIYGGPQHDVLNIPRDALIVTGERETAIKALGAGRFQPVDVVTGMRRGGQVEILSGLARGDEAVVSGQFLIDSESSLQASFRRMAKVPAAGNHVH